MPVYHRGRTPFYCCNLTCRDGFRADRTAGLIYGPYKKPDGSFYKDVEQFSMQERCCAYCNAPEPLRFADLKIGQHFRFADPTEFGIVARRVNLDDYPPGQRFVKLSPRRYACADGQGVIVNGELIPDQFMIGSIHVRVETQFLVPSPTEESNAPAQNPQAPSK